MSAPGDILGERYTLVERIGRGGMGSVWRADDARLGRQVAVKILNSDMFGNETSVQRFRREAKLVAAIDHPGIVDVYDYGESADDGEHDGCSYIVMELIEGRPLDRLLEEDGGTLPVEHALTLVAEALDALEAAHRRKIVHRDIKPSNLMVRTDGRLAVTDFGIARAVASTKLTAPYGIIGTAFYMSPEQAEGLDAGPASDLYSIGVVCYELLVGEPPYTGEGQLQIALKHVSRPVPQLPGTFPAAVQALVARALAKKPEDRFASAAAMAAAARAAIGAAGAAGPAESAGLAGVGGALLAVDRPEDREPEAAEDPSEAETEDMATEGAETGDATGGDATGEGATGGGAETEAGRTPRGRGGARPAPGDLGKVEPRQSAGERGRRSLRTMLVPVIIPIVITVSTATVLLIDRGPGGSNAATPPGSQPTVVVTAPVTPSGDTPGAQTAAPMPPSPTYAPTAGQQPGQPDPNQPQPPGQGGNAGTSSGGGTQQGRGNTAGSGNGGGSGTSSGTGPGAGGGAGGGNVGGQVNQPSSAVQPPADSNTNPSPQPPPKSSGGATGGSTTPGGGQTTPQAPARPVNCGGDSWIRIVSAENGMAIGMAGDSLAGDTPIVLGGATQYGWVVSGSEFKACNSGGPELVQTMKGGVALNNGLSFLRLWDVRTTSSGTHTMGENGNANCMTSQGPGRPLIMEGCTPGLKSQEWRFE